MLNSLLNIKVKSRFLSGKKQLLIIIFIFSFLQQSFSQNPLVKQWDKRFGGTNTEYLYSLQQTADGGYILGGWSLSGIGGDKTQASWGGTDYWIVKIDALGNKQWDKNFGGTNQDRLQSVQQTADGGYILGGYSFSGIGGDKTEALEGQADYWIVKTNSLGIKEWDKDLGGTQDDILSSIQQTKDGGYILAGFTYSGIGGDKTQPTWGSVDYWIVKTDSLGNKLWDKDFGGTDGDELYSMQQTTDGGFILGGHSFSNIGGDKTQALWGGMDPDYWILKTYSLGNKQWDKDFGGVGGEYFSSMQQCADGGYILGGYSFSDVSGNKTQPVWGGPGDDDYWIVKTDSLGNYQWDKDLGGTNGEQFIGTISQTADRGYLIAGSSYSFISGDKTENNLAGLQTWVVKTDSLGIKQWDKTLHTIDYGFDSFALEAKDGCYAFANYTASGIGADKTQPNWDPTNITLDFWIIKFCDSTLTTPITQLPGTQSPFSIYPNPANEYAFINYHFKAGDEIRLTDVLGKLLYTTKIKEPTLNFKLQTLNLSPGIYFLKAGNEVRRFVKE
jgi:hypothetical protein